jgi:hypothetical protein
MLKRDADGDPQVVLEMDANRSDKVVLSSWDSFIFFHRVQPGFVHVTRVVTRDPSASTVRDRQGAVYTSVAHDWTPLKLVFALLLVALHPDRLQGFAHKTASHLETPSKFAKRKKSRAASTDQSLTSSASSVFPEPFSLPHLQVG